MTYLEAVDIVCINCKVDTTKAIACELCPVRNSVDNTPKRAAAPELLKALEAANKELDKLVEEGLQYIQVSRGSHVRAQARAVIAKAKGETCTQK